MPHYTIVTKDGESLGAFRLNGQDWREGDVIPRGPKEPSLHVVDVLPSDDPERFAILVVERRGGVSAAAYAQGCGRLDNLRPGAVRAVPLQAR